jgi:hypothetical protein
MIAFYDNLANQLKNDFKFCANWLESTVRISGDGRLIFNQMTSLIANDT